MGFKKWLSTGFVILSLVGCGGGGDSDSGGTTPPLPSNIAPTANAGDDQTVDENTLVTLTGSGSDSDGSITSYSWVQTSGEDSAIESGSSAETLISIPSVDSDSTLTFELTVTDNDGSTHSDSIDIQVTYINDVVVLNENETSAITSQLQTSLQVDENSELSNKKVGDIVIADVSDVLPNGLFVKITEKSNANGITTFVTEQPGLKEVIKEGELSISKTFEPSDFASMTTSPTPVGMKLYVKNDNFTYSGLTQQPRLQSKKKSKSSSFQSVKQLTTEVSWDSDVFQGCDNPNRMNSGPSVVIVLENVGLYQNINNDNEEPIFDTGALGLYKNDAYEKIVSVDGCLGMNFGYDFVLDFNLFTSDHYLFTVNPEQYGELQITGKLAEAKLELKRELHKWILPKIKVLVGVIPVWITPEISIMWGLDATAGANIFTGVSEYAGVEFGIEYKNNELSPIVESDFEFNYQPPTLALYAEAESYIGPNLALKIYDIVGPNADLQLYANALVQNDDPWWKLTVGARAGAGIKVEVFDKEIEKLSFSISGIIDKEINSWQAQTPLLGTPANIEAQEAENSVTLTWDEVPNASTYTVFYGASSELDAFSEQVEVTTNSATVNGLQSETTYYFAVTAHNVDSSSTFSEVISATTLEATAGGGQQPSDDIIYSEDFDSDPSFTSYSTTHAYWDSSEGNYYVQTRDNLNYKYWAHSGNLGDIDPTTQDIDLSFDVMIENQNWGTYPNIGFYSDIPTEINDSSRVFLMQNANADNSRERFGTCTYASTPAKCIHNDQWSVDNNVWYRVQYEIRNAGTTINWTVTDILTGNVIANFQNEDFVTSSFSYIGVGYYNQADYGSTWAPMRMDNISITSSNTQSNTINITGSWNYSGYYEDCLNAPAEGTMLFSEKDLLISGEDWHHDCTISNLEESSLSHSLNSLLSVTPEEFKAILALFYNTSRFEFQNTKYKENHMVWRIVDGYDNSVEILELIR
jgi:hypothetical protein